MKVQALKSSLLLGAASVCIFGGAPVMAQDKAAQGANEENGSDIIVTARRVEEKLQDVPISITVFNGEQLTKRNIAVATDLVTYTPSLTVNQRYGPEKAAFNIRGFNQDSSTAPTVGVYFAEVVGVRAQGGTTSGNTVGAGAFTDLQNVQVLKGPQGTLFGRNTTGGAILLTPKKPSDKFEGYVEGTAGNYNQLKVTGALNIPISDTFKVRAVVERNKRDGFMRNLAGVGPNDYNNLNYTYARLSIVADLTPDLENYTVVHYSDSNTNGYASKQIACATPSSVDNPLNTVTGSPGFSGTRYLQATSCLQQVARQTARGDGIYDVETSNANPFLKIRQWQAINTTTWKASDNLTIKNIVSYGQFRERANFDLGSSNYFVNATDVGFSLTGAAATGFNLKRISASLPNVVVPNGTAYQRIVLDTANPDSANAQESTLTEELQFQGNSSDNKLNYVVGGYLEFSRPIGWSEGRTGIFLNCVRPQNLTCSNPLLFGSISESATKLKFDNHGVFAQATYKFTDALSLTGGFRYTFDKIVGLTQGTRAGFSASAATGPLFPDPLTGVLIARACTDSFRHIKFGPTADPAVVANPPAADRSVCQTTLTNSSNKPTWLIDIDYKPSNDLLLYAKYARGYRQGGINFTNPGVETWQPEKTENFELGAKTSFRGAVSGYFNVAAFYNTLANQQIFAGLIPDALNASLGVAGGNAIINAGKSRIYGAEFDASAVFAQNFRVDLGYTFLDTKITNSGAAAVRGDGSPLGTFIVGTPFGQIIPTSVAGQSFTLTPKHRITVTGTYTLPMDEKIGKLSLGVTWTHASSSINDYSVPAFVNGQPVGFTPANDLVNVNVDWKGVGGTPIDAAFFVTNLFNEAYNVANTGGWNSAGVAEIILNPPRFWGFRLKYSFGN